MMTRKTKLLIRNLRKFFILFFIIWIICGLDTVAQQGISFNRIEELYSKYPEKDAVVLHSTVDVVFSLNRRTNTPIVERTENMTLGSLKPNNRINLTYYRSNQSEFDVKKSLAFETLCGDYEVDGIFHTDAKFCNYSYFATSIGQEFDFELTETFKDLRYYSVDFFSTEFPTLHKTVNFHIPAGMKIDLHYYNLDDLSYTIDTLQNSQDNSKIIRMVMHDVPYFKNEPRATSLQSNYPHVLVCSRTYTNSDGKTIKIIDSLDDLYAWYNSLISFVENDTNSLRPILNNIIANCSSPSEKLSCILKWVQKNIRYIAIEYEMAGYIPENAQTVVQNKYGDCKGVSNLTKTFLQMEGFDARLCWIGTNDLIYNYSTPSLAIDNHMICAVVDKEDITYLDPTATFTRVGEYPEYIQGKEVLVENGDAYIRDTIPVMPCKLNKTNYSFKLYLDEGKLSGKLNATISGNQKARLLTLLNSLKLDEKHILQSMLFNNDKNLEWDNSGYVLSEDSLLHFHSEVALKKNVLNNGDQVFLKLSPLVLFENDFIDTARFRDYTYDEKLYLEYDVDLKLPDGYEVVRLPGNNVIDEGNYKVEYTYQKIDNSIRFYRRFYLHSVVINKEEFSRWNEFLKTLRKEDNQRIILKRIS